MSRTLVYLIYFTLYSFLLLFIGKSSLRDSDSIAKFFVGEKKTGTRALFFTFVGTWISAATILGYTGNVYQHQSAGGLRYPLVYGGAAFVRSGKPDSGVRYFNDSGAF